MIQRILSSLLVVMIVLGLSTVTFAQEVKKEEPKKDMPKSEMPKSDMSQSGSTEMAKMETGPLKSVSCEDACGFMVRSRNEKEVISAVKAHFKHIHKKDVTDKQVKEMMKTESGGMHN